MFKNLTAIAVCLLLGACVIENTTDNVVDVAKPSNVENSVQVTQLAKTESANEDYDNGVITIKSNPTLQLVKQLKLDYIKTDYYQPFDGTEQKLSEQMFGYLEAKDWENCLSSAEQILITNYISFNGHYGAMACSFESDEKSLGLHHRQVLGYLLEAMWQSGDGKSPGSALVSLSSSEIYGFLKLTGLQVLKQSMFEYAEQSFELLRVKEPDSNEEFDLFFNNSTQWQYGFKHIN